MPALLDITRTSEQYSASGTYSYELGVDTIFCGHSYQDSLQCGWDFSESEGLNAWSDRLGFLPLFLYQLQNRVVISDDIFTLLAVLGDQRWDEPALSVFLRLGFFLGNDTPFENVKVLPPATTLKWRGEPVHWPEDSYFSSAMTISWDKACSTYETLFAASVSRRLNSDLQITLPLSGGRDSRHILLELEKLGHKPIEALTVRPLDLGESEVKPARSLANRFGIPHRVLDVDRLGLLETEIRKNRLTYLLSIEHAWYLSLIPSVNLLSNAVFDGIGGDVLSNGLFFSCEILDKLKSGAITEAVRALLPEMPLPFLSKELSRRFNYDLAFQRLKKELIRHVEMPDALKSFFFRNRTRRGIAVAPFCLAGRRLPTSTPFLDADLLEFLMSLPYQQFGQPGFHDEVITRSFPNAGHIPFATKHRQKISWWDDRAIAIALLRFGLQHPHIEGTNSLFVWLRLVKALGKGGQAELWWVNPVIYLQMLHDVSKTSRGRPLDEGKADQKL